MVEETIRARKVISYHASSMWKARTGLDWATGILEGKFNGRLILEEWRAKALESFPDLQDIVNEEQGGPVGLWIELFYKLTRAYDEQPTNDDLIRRIYDYADWCLNQPSTGDANTDPSSAAACGLFESNPLNQQVSEDLYRWISVEQFEGFENLFRYLQSDEEFLRFSDQFMKKKKEFTK